MIEKLRMVAVIDVLYQPSDRRHRRCAEPVHTSLLILRTVKSGTIQDGFCMFCAGSWHVSDLFQSNRDTRTDSLHVHGGVLGRMGLQCLHEEKNEAARPICRARRAQRSRSFLLAIPMLTYAVDIEEGISASICASMCERLIQVLTSADTCPSRSAMPRSSSG